MYLLFVVSFIHLHICSTSTEGEAVSRAGILLQRFSASLFGTGHGDQTAHGRKRPSVRIVSSPSVSLLTCESVRLPCVSVCVDSPLYLSQFDCCIFSTQHFHALQQTPVYFVNVSIKPE